MEVPILPKKSTIEPGIYIGSRRVGAGKGSTLSPVGRHQFFVLVPRDPESFQGTLTDLGGGVRGAIVATYQGERKGFFSDPPRLQYHRNAKDELDAVKAYMDRLRDPKYVDRFDTQLSRVKNYGTATDRKIREILGYAERFRQQEKEKPVWYPGVLANALSLKPNSNSFVQTIADLAKLRHRRKDFPGMDTGNQLRLPETYFKEEPKMKEASIGYLDGYLMKIAEGPAGGVRLAAGVDEDKRQRQLAYNKAMQAYRKQLAKQTRQKRMQTAGAGVGQDWLKGLDVDPGLRKRMLERLGIDLSESTSPSGASVRSLGQPESTAYPVPAKPVKPKI